MLALIVLLKTTIAIDTHCLPYLVLNTEFTAAMINFIEFIIFFLYLSISIFLIFCIYSNYRLWFCSDGIVKTILYSFNYQSVHNVPFYHSENFIYSPNRQFKTLNVLSLNRTVLRFVFFFFFVI